MPSVLLIEDDTRIHKTLRLLFESEGYSLEVASDGVSGIEAFRSTKPSVVILDLKLPKMSGRDVLREIRKEAASQPVIMLSAISEEVDKVLLLELGADDYVTKPFSPKELLARVGAVMRRAERTLPSDAYSFGDIVVDFAKMEVTRDGKPVTLTAHEFKTLKYFTQNPERVLSRDELLNQVWGYECYPSTRTVDNHILRLRQKLEKDPVNPLHFRTVHKVGYKFVPFLKVANEG
ncbi:MAG: response regulator transcription factor [Terriglobia bacterium]|jgi:DNA-binding response OmpR family regulator